MKYCLPQPYSIVSVSCLYPPVKRVRFKIEDLPEKITQMVASNYYTTVKELKNKSRKRENVMARQISMTLISIFVPTMSLMAIGRMFKRDHSTVIYSKQTVEDLCDSDKKYKKEYTALHDRVRIFIDKGTIESDLTQLNLRDK